MMINTDYNTPTVRRGQVLDDIQTFLLFMKHIRYIDGGIESVKQGQHAPHSTLTDCIIGSNVSAMQVRYSLMSMVKNHYSIQ